MTGPAVPSERRATYLESLREGWGCPGAPRLWRWHDFQWDYDEQGWWLYCARCGRPIWKAGKPGQAAS